MKNLVVPFIILFLIITSCNPENNLMGKKYYALDVKIDAMNIAEYQMNFASSDKVEMTPMIYCNSMECLTKENSPKRFEKTAIKDYRFNENYLKIDGIPDLSKITFLPNGDMKANNGETMYKTSIKELSDEEKQARITDFLKGNKALGQVFSKMLNNSAPRPLIEKDSNGNLKFH